MAQADWLIVNGNIFTADPRQPFAQAVAIRGNRIMWVGGDEDAAAWRGVSTQVIDAAGKTVMPGIIDSHFHLLLGSIEAADLQLYDALTMGDIEEKLRGWVAAKGDEEWLVGQQ